METSVLTRELHSFVAGRLVNFFIDVSNSSDRTTTTDAVEFAQEPTPFTGSETRVYETTGEIYGQYVIVRLERTEFLQLCEVQVQGTTDYNVFRNRDSMP